MQNRFIEKFIDSETEKMWDSFLSIDIGMKNGFEPVAASLRNEIEISTYYLGLKKYLENNDVTEIWLTDDFIDFKGPFMWLLLELLHNKNVLTHIRVEENKVAAVKKDLNDALERVLDKGYLVIKWRHEDKSYVIELMRRHSDRSMYILRLYKSGSGVLVHDSISDQNIIYFIVDEELRNSIIEIAEKKVLDIVNHPEETHEDDRYLSFPVHLRYGLEWKIPNADEMLGQYEYYEDCEYASSENDIPLALMLLGIPEVKSVWPEPDKNEMKFYQTKKKKGRRKEEL